MPARAEVLRGLPECGCTSHRRVVCPPPPARSVASHAVSTVILLVVAVLAIRAVLAPTAPAPRKRQRNRFWSLVRIVRFKLRILERPFVLGRGKLVEQAGRNLVTLLVHLLRLGPLNGSILFAGGVHAVSC